MIQNAVSIIMNILLLGFLLLTFYWGYEFLVATRLLLVAFMAIYLIVQLRKNYISISKSTFMILSALFLLVLTGTIVFDHYLSPSFASDRDFLIPVFGLSLLGLLYQDLKKETQEEE